MRLETAGTVAHEDSSRTERLVSFSISNVLRALLHRGLALAEYAVGAASDITIKPIVESIFRIPRRRNRGPRVVVVEPWRMAENPSKVYLIRIPCRDHSRKEAFCTVNRTVLSAVSTLSL